jgi:hypothetical protein
MEAVKQIASRKPATFKPDADSLLIIVKQIYKICDSDQNGFFVHANGKSAIGEIAQVMQRPQFILGLDSQLALTK